MIILLDTHILLWWVMNHPDLRAPYRQTLKAIEKESGSVAISQISFWEIAKLVEKKRHELNLSIDDWFSQLEEDSFYQILPLTTKIILDSTRLGSKFNNDPADQIIAATARCHGLKLMTQDKHIRKSGVVALV